MAYIYVFFQQHHQHNNSTNKNIVCTPPYVLYLVQNDAEVESWAKSFEVEPL